MAAGLWSAALPDWPRTGRVTARLQTRARSRGYVGTPLARAPCVLHAPFCRPGSAVGSASPLSTRKSLPGRLLPSRTCRGSPAHASGWWAGSRQPWPPPGRPPPAHRVSPTHLGGAPAAVLPPVPISFPAPARGQRRDSGPVTREGGPDGVDVPRWPCRDCTAPRAHGAGCGWGDRPSPHGPFRPAGADRLGPDMECRASAGSTEEARASLSRCCDGQ